MAALYAVLTGDLVGSSDLTAHELDTLRQSLTEAVAKIRGWREGLVVGDVEFYRGDAWQLLITDPKLFLRVALYLRATLRQEGHAVDWVRDVAAARGTLASERFDLVLLDLGLPPGGSAASPAAVPADGLGVLRELRARHDDTPVIVLSASALPEDIVRARARGASDYWTKPLDFPLFLAGVARALDGAPVD